MKKIMIIFFVILFSNLSLSQIEKDIELAVLSLEKEKTTVDNSYLQGQFLKLIQDKSYDEILNASHKEGFKRFTKRIHIDNIWKKTITADNDSIFVLMLEDIRKGLPKGMEYIPSEIGIETLIDDYVTDYWTYTNSSGKKCEIRAYFINNQLRNLGYWIYE